MRYTDYEESVFQGFAPSFSKTFSLDPAAMQRVYETYRALLDEEPDDGGVQAASHSNTVMVLFTFAVYRVTGVSDDAFFTGLEASLRDCDWYMDACRRLGAACFTKEWQVNKALEAKQSERQEHGFQIRFEPGETLDCFTIYFTRCPICAFLKRQNAAALIPRYCALDYTLAELMGFRLVRTGTIGGGADACDFQYNRF